MNSPGERLRSVRIKAGFSTAKEAALKMGVPITTYAQHEIAEHHLPARKAAQYAAFYKTTPEYLLYGREDALQSAIDLITSDGKIIQCAVKLPPAPSSITKAQMPTPGDGVAEAGLVALYDLPQDGHPPLDLNGRLCVVALPDEDGERLFIRIVSPGSSPQRFHLTRLSGGLVHMDQSVNWLSPVKALIPR